MRYWASLLTLMFFGLSLAGCDSDTVNTRQAHEPLETISGKLFPFSSALKNDATHRLEDENGRLVSYISSEIVELANFEGREVSFEGINRPNPILEEIFWVESVNILDLSTTEKKGELLDEKYFATSKYFFLYPSHWEYSTASDGTSYFLDNTDTNRRVFLQFLMENIVTEDSKTVRNAQINDFSVSKTVNTDNFGNDSEVIIFYSKKYDKKYTFRIHYPFNDIEKKTAFRKILNSFIDGEWNVKQAIKAYKKKEAETEAKRIKKDESIVSVPDKSSKSFEQQLTEKIEQPLKPIKKHTFELKKNGDTSTSSQAKIVHQTPTNFENLIDDRAFPYANSFYEISLKVPFRFWFYNFGKQNDTTIGYIGFATKEIKNRGDEDFSLSIIHNKNPIKNFTEKELNNNIIIEFPRGPQSMFRFQGDKRFRDAMLSIHSTINK